MKNISVFTNTLENYKCIFMTVILFCKTHLSEVTEEQNSKEGEARNFRNCYEWEHFRGYLKKSQANTTHERKKKKNNGGTAQLKRIKIISDCTFLTDPTQLKVNKYISVGCGFCGVFNVFVCLFVFLTNDNTLSYKWMLVPQRIIFWQEEKLWRYQLKKTKPKQNKKTRFVSIYPGYGNNRPGTCKKYVCIYNYVSGCRWTEGFRTWLKF